MIKHVLQVGILASALVSPAAASENIYEIVRIGQVQPIEQLLEAGLPVDHRDDHGNTLLMRAIVYGRLELAQALLDRGADVNASNKAGATALMRAQGDLKKTRLLLERGAEVNARSALGNTALILAARATGAASALQLLLARGAEVNATNRFGATALMAAAASGDAQSVKVLLRHGAEVNAHSRGSEEATLWGGGRSPLLWAAFRGDLEVAEILLKAGAEMNAPEGMGSALSQAAWADDVSMARFLLERGADVHQADIFSGFTPLHWAASAEHDDPALVKLMLKHGASPNIPGGEPVDAFMGIPQTPLMLARKRGDTEIVHALLAAGAEERKSVAPEKPVVPKREPLTREALFNALEKAVGPLQETAIQSKAAFLRHSSRQDCVSCHQQYLPLIATAYARGAGAAVDDALDEQVLAMVRADNTNLYELTAQATFHPEPAIAYGYTLLALASQGQPADPQVDAMIHHLMVIQDEGGQWHYNLPRPPMQSSDVTATALAVHALKHYSFPARRNEIEQRIERARRWLNGVKPVTTEERAFQLLGLAWAGEPAVRLQAWSQELIKEQRADGGWAQLPTLSSDVYGTGLALFALGTGGGVPATSPAFRRGLEFLVATQESDGTWQVHRRAFPFQPTMRSGYPHYRDSWISATGSSWAVAALSLAAKEQPVQVTTR